MPAPPHPRAGYSEPLTIRSTIISVALFGGLTLGCAHKPPAPVTVNLQGDTLPTCADSFVRGFYDITVQAFSNGPANVDVD
jgi:hypothetical protein